MMAITVMLTAFMILSVLLIVQSCGDGNVLKGTWDYDRTTAYEFGGRKNGALVLPSISFDFTYNIQGDQLVIDFVNESLRDSTYTFSVKDDALTMTGGEGTVGGNYELTKKE